MVEWGLWKCDKLSPSLRERDGVTLSRFVFVSVMAYTETNTLSRKWISRLDSRPRLEHGLFRLY